MALAVFKNREMTPEEVEKGMVAGIVGGGAGESSSSQAGVDARGRRKGRGRIMMSLGVVMGKRGKIAGGFRCHCPAFLRVCG